MRKISTFALLIASLACLPTILFATPIKSRIAGGAYQDLTHGPVALVVIQSLGTCSGILVSKRHVLTAAHCAIPNVDVSSYFVIINGTAYTVSSKTFNPTYNHNGSPGEEAPYDIGMLTLSADVEDVSPLPILRDKKIQVGEKATIYGYGATETSGIDNRTILENGKFAEVYFNSVDFGLLESNFLVNNTSPCQGDSGGPAVQKFGSIMAVIGVTSVGTNELINGTCVVGSDSGYFAYVDLQSETSQRFLSNFPEATIVSGHNIRIKNKTRSLAIAAEKASKLGTLNALISKAKTFSSEVTSLIRIASSQRKLLESAQKTLQRSARTKSLLIGSREMKKAANIFKEIAEIPAY